METTVCKSGKAFCLGVFSVNEISGHVWVKLGELNESQDPAALCCSLQWRGGCCCSAPQLNAVEVTRCVCMQLYSDKTVHSIRYVRGIVRTCYLLFSCPAGAPVGQPHALFGGFTQCNTIQCNAIQYNTIQCNAMQYIAIQCNTMQCNATQQNTMQCNTMQRNAMQYNTTKYNTMQYNTTKYNTMQYNTIQYNAIQYNEIQHNTIQCNAMQCNFIVFV